MTPAPISVERFEPEIGQELLNPVTETYRQVAVMEPFFAGEYVRHSDYAALLQQLAEREARILTLRETADRATARADDAERAREEAMGLLREVINNPHADGDALLDSKIAAFLAASGGDKT